MKTRSKIRIPMPARYVINLALVVGFYFLLTGLISSGVITNYWTGILITVGINIILAVSLNIATGYLGQLPLGHAGALLQHHPGLDGSQGPEEPARHRGRQGDGLQVQRL